LSYRDKVAAALSEIRRGRSVGDACKAAGISVHKLQALAPEDYSRSLAKRQARHNRPDPETRRRAMRDLYDTGRWSYAGLAAAWGVTRQRAQQIVKAAETDAPGPPPP